MNVNLCRDDVSLGMSLLARTIGCRSIGGEKNVDASLFDAPLFNVPGDYVVIMIINVHDEYTHIRCE